MLLEEKKLTGGPNGGQGETSDFKAKKNQKKKAPKRVATLACQKARKQIEI